MAIHDMNCISGALKRTIMVGWGLSERIQLVMHSEGRGLFHGRVCEWPPSPLAKGTNQSCASNSGHHSSRCCCASHEHSERGFRAEKPSNMLNSISAFQNKPAGREFIYPTKMHQWGFLDLSVQTTLLRKVNIFQYRKEWGNDMHSAQERTLSTHFFPPLLLSPTWGTWEVVPGDHDHSQVEH